MSERVGISVGSGSEPGANHEVNEVKGKPLLWNPIHISTIGFFLSPIIGAYLVSRNWRELGENAKAARSMLWAYVYIAMILVFAIFIPNVSFFIPGLLFIFLWIGICVDPQRRFIKKKLGRDYTGRSWIIPIFSGIGIMVFLVFFWGTTMFAHQYLASKSLRDTLGESARPVVTEILRERISFTAPECVEVTNVKKIAKSRYQAVAKLANGERLRIAIPQHDNDRIYVEVLGRQ